MTPQDAQDIIDNLEVCEYHNVKCVVCHPKIDNYKPILIGDVLENMKQSAKQKRWIQKAMERLKLDPDTATLAGQLCNRWSKFGFNKSLQDILRDGVDSECNKHITIQEEPCSEECPYALSPQTENLFKFLKEIS